MNELVNLTKLGSECLILQGVICLRMTETAQLCPDKAVARQALTVVILYAKLDFKTARYFKVLYDNLRRLLDPGWI